jgi:type I restriction enzyme S subunit
MSFPRYPKYKASGVEWLGEVPEGWEVKRARAVGVFSSSGIDKKSVDGEPAVQMFNYLDVYKSPDKILRYSEDLMWTTAPASKVAEHSVVLDDILLTPSSETADDIGHAARVTYVPPNILYSYHILRFRKGVGFDASFVTHCFNAVPIRSYFESVCTGTTRKVLVRDDFKNAPFAIPPLPEQTAIAEFLDRETGKIDELVAEQRRLMELLQEKRQAVISHAVTKGLNPHAPMKSSGNEWIGDVPEEWQVMPLRRSISFLTDYEANGSFADTKDNVAIDSGVPYAWYVRATDLENGRFGIVEGNRFCDEKTFNWLRKTALQGGELLVAKRGEIGKIYTMPIVDGHATLAPNLYLIRLNQKLLPLYAWYWFSVDPGKAELVLADKSTTIGALYKDDVKSCIVLMPSLMEQTKIVAFLETELAKFDTLTSEAQRAIDLLQERRTALISAAVTGQIDVRNQSPEN